MRTLVIKQDTQLDPLSHQLLRAGLSGAQRRSALASLQALNLHADFTRLRAGTVLLVPDTPSFKATASDPVQGGVLEDFQQFVRTAVAQTGAELKAATVARAAERTDILAALKSTALKRAIEGDAELRQQVDEVAKALEREKKQTGDAERLLAAAGKAAAGLRDSFG